MNSPKTNIEWLTSPEMIAALGEFALDPCTPEIMPWSTARCRYTRREDGLNQPWFARAFLNPPFGPHATKWLARMREHGSGIALIPARTETRMFFDSVWGHAAGVCFVKGRPRFLHPDGTKDATSINAPICLIAYGEHNLAALERCGFGMVVASLSKGTR